MADYENPFYRTFGAEDYRSPGFLPDSEWMETRVVEEDDAGTRIIYSPEIGERVTTEEAIRERVRLHPRARTREILAMFELDGAKVSPELVQRIKREELGELT